MRFRSSSQPAHGRAKRAQMPLFSTSASSRGFGRCRGTRCARCRALQTDQEAADACRSPRRNEHSLDIFQSRNASAPRLARVRPLLEPGGAVWPCVQHSSIAALAAALGGASGHPAAHGFMTQISALSTGLASLELSLNYLPLHPPMHQHSCGDCLALRRWPGHPPKVTPRLRRTADVCSTFEQWPAESW